MLRELGVYGAIVGHSERRQFFGETDEGVGKRARPRSSRALVIACVGETEAEREAGETEEVLRRQVSVLEAEDDLVVAYEPVWAIGTGKTATPEKAQEAHAFIKSLLDVPVLYGGSVKPENAAELLGQPDVDGALVGGASLDLDSFAAICLAGTRSSRSSSSTAGGSPARPGQRRRARGHAGLRPPLGRVSAHDARGVGRGGRPAAGSDGQLGGRAPDDRLWPHPLPGPDAGEQVDRGRLVLREPRARRRLRARRDTSTCSGSSPTAASTRTSTT